MHGFTDQEVQSCNSEITEHLHDIYLELVNNPNLNVRQVCQAFGECPVIIIIESLTHFSMFNFRAPRRRPPCDV
jgi:hypothetical protein